MTASAAVMMLTTMAVMTMAVMTLAGMMLAVVMSQYDLLLILESLVTMVKNHDSKNKCKVPIKT